MKISMPKLLRVAAVVLAISLSSCAPLVPPLGEGMKDEVSTIHVVSFVPQEQLDVQVIHSNSAIVVGAAFGLVGGLVAGSIDASINHGRMKTAQQQADKLRLQLSNVDTGAELNNGFETVFKNLDWAELVVFEANMPIEEFKFRDYIQNVDADALLVMTTRYSLTPELETLEFRTNLTMYRVPEKLTSKSVWKRARLEKEAEFRNIKPFYEGSLIYQSQYYGIDYMVHAGESLNNEIALIKARYEKKISKVKGKRANRALRVERDHIIKTLRTYGYVKLNDEPERNSAWIVDNGSLIRATIQEGINEQAQLLALDINSKFDDADSVLPQKDVRILHTSGIGMTSARSNFQNVWILSEKENRIRVKLKNGLVYSYEKNEFPRQNLAAR